MPVLGVPDEEPVAGAEAAEEGESVFPAVLVSFKDTSGHQHTHGDALMKENYTAVVKKSGDWWIGWIDEVPGVNCQERTRDELLESLRTTLKEALDFNRRDALEAAGEGYDEESIAL